MSANSQHQTCFEFYWRSTFLSPLDQELILDWFYQSIPGEYCSRDRQKSFRGNKSGDVQPWQSFHSDLWCYWSQVTTLVKAQRERKVRETAIDKQKWNKKNETKTKRKLKTGEERRKRNAWQVIDNLSRKIVNYSLISVSPKGKFVISVVFLPSQIELIDFRMFVTKHDNLSQRLSPFSQISRIKICISLSGQMKTRHRWTLLSLLLLFIQWFSPIKRLLHFYVTICTHMTMCAVTWCLQRLRTAVYASQESGASICCYTSLKASGICSNLATTTLARSNTDGG